MNVPDATADPDDPGEGECGFGSSGRFGPLYFSDSSGRDLFIAVTAGDSSGGGRHPARRQGGDSSGISGPGWESYGRLGYCIWRFDGSAWQVVSMRGVGDAVSGRPPREPGSYIGEHRKKFCEPGP